ncbi:helix-turn-helix domain-containing protein [Leptospira santarosai]|uniref:helix-turn-helix domain-containing protein n=1 Tax=Leptospira santarosai TaxID=28183 RepID=UPI00095900CD|nr:helix-turn-helix transcriptional regulator [Leptospira santarosai]MDI7227933.1 helix-turn-helix transcriptional regulator [Leptospira santarosai]OLY61059.1 transcriptional regulator [Leptospira santarosai serovar Guaricura]
MDNVAQNKISKRVRELIDALGITQREFADKLNLTPAFINNVLNQGKSFSQETIIKISFKFRVNINWLLSGEGDMFIPSAEEIHKQVDEFRELWGKLRKREGMMEFVRVVADSTEDEWKRIREMARLLLGR